MGACMIWFISRNKLSITNNFLKLLKKIFYIHITESFGGEQMEGIGVNTRENS